MGMGIQPLSHMIINLYTLYIYGLRTGKTSGDASHPRRR